MMNESAASGVLCGTSAASAVQMFCYRRVRGERLAETAKTADFGEVG